MGMTDPQLLSFDTLTQPNDSACGPTCLHAVYRYYADRITLGEVLETTERLEDGGTLAVLLGCHALRRGYRATIYTYNLQVFDPSWFTLGGIDVCSKLLAQAEHKKGSRLQVATRAYVEFLQGGGTVRLEDLTPNLIRRYLKRSIPIITGLSSTYLYRSKRELGVGSVLEFDDVLGVPMGHFVVLCGYDRAERLVQVADPWGQAAVAQAGKYWVGIDRLINSILLGIITYDANLLIIEKARKPGESLGYKEP
jgi:hypothetical protein